jgi:hypothetical protein
LFLGSQILTNARWESCSKEGQSRKNECLGIHDIEILKYAGEADGDMLEDVFEGSANFEPVLYGYCE